MSGGKSPVLLRKADGVAHVVLDRAEARNALNLPMCLALKDIFEALDSDPDIRAVVLSANGPVFCAGADLKERNGRDMAWVIARRRASFAAYDTIARCRKPVVAATQGPVVGSGGEWSSSSTAVAAPRTNTLSMKRMLAARWPYGLLPSSPALPP